MASPPSSPPELHGASHVTGGTTHGKAVGNVMNIADADNDMDMVVKRMGKIHLYDSLVDPTEAKPKRVLKVDVNFSMAPILKSIAPKWSPIYSKPLHIDLHFVEYFTETNPSISTFEDNEWNVKGCYETALEFDEDVEWIKKSNEYILPICYVRSFFRCENS